MKKIKLAVILGIVFLFTVSCSFTPDLLSALHTLQTQVAELPQITTATPAVTSPSITINGNVSQLDAVLVSLYQKVSPGIVSIVTTTKDGYSSGSGFVFDKDGHIVTNYHVVEGATQIEVDFVTGVKVRATIVGEDLDSDLAVLHVDVDSAELTPLQVGDSDQLQVGQMVVAIGSPFYLSGSMSLGIVSAKGRMLDSMHSTNDNGVYSAGDLIQTDAAINPGNSGGPLFNLEGEVVGVNRAISTNSYNEDGTPLNSGIGYSVSSNIVKRVVPAIINSGSYAYPYLGISSYSYDLILDEWEALGLTQTSGVYVMEVTPGGPAEQAGLKAGTHVTSISGLYSGGDLITQVDGRTVLMYSDLISYIMANKSPGDVVQLTIIRDGQEIQIPLTLGSRK
ncbi:MAG: trypsin-like peptidase domain-containing protein [Anaerolineaceae bacterium]|nr:trypsin-like peptidase domain-containing protein [Anaerolineaceae bacterium]